VRGHAVALRRAREAESLAWVGAGAQAGVLTHHSVPSVSTKPPARLPASCRDLDGRASTRGNGAAEGRLAVGHGGPQLDLHGLGRRAHAPAAVGAGVGEEHDIRPDLRSACITRSGSVGTGTTSTSSASKARSRNSPNVLELSTIT
jgi:hypothetical protein